MPMHLIITPVKADIECTLQLQQNQITETKSTYDMRHTAVSESARPSTGKDETNGAFVSGKPKVSQYFLIPWAIDLVFAKWSSVPS
jgi:hypothetical protein